MGARSACVCVCAYTGAHKCGVHWRALSVFLYLFLPYSLETWSLLNLELDSHPQNPQWSSGHHVNSSGAAALCSNTQLFAWVVGSELMACGIWTLVLTLTKTSYPQNHLQPSLIEFFPSRIVWSFFFNFLIMFLSFCHPHSVFISLTFMSSPRSRPVLLSLILLSEHTQCLLAVQTESSRMLAT